MTEQRPLKGKRILVLEDDFYLAKDEKILLEQAGANVVGPYGSGYLGHELPGEGNIDCAIVDINLWHGPRFDFARDLKNRDVPFVFVTGYDAAVVPPELSHIPRIEKPIRRQELIDAIVRLMGGR